MRPGAPDPVALATVLAALSAFLAVRPRLALPTTGEGDEKPRSESGNGVRVAAALGAFVAAAAIVGGVVGVAAGVAGALWLWRLLGGLESRAHRERREDIERRAPLLADLVADALSAGVAPAEALRVAAEASGPPLDEELSAYTARLELGAEPDTVWAQLAAHDQLGAVGRAFVRAGQTGSSVTSSMRRSAEDMRAARRAAREAAARAVAVKAAGPLGAFLLPAFVLVGVVPVVAGAVASLLG